MHYMGKTCKMVTCVLWVLAGAAVLSGQAFASTVLGAVLVLNGLAGLIHSLGMCGMCSKEMEECCDGCKDCMNGKCKKHGMGMTSDADKDAKK